MTYGFESWMVELVLVSDCHQQCSRFRHLDKEHARYNVRGRLLVRVSLPSQALASQNSTLTIILQCCLDIYQRGHRRDAALPLCGHFQEQTQRRRIRLNRGSGRNRRSTLHATEHAIRSDNRDSGIVHVSPCAYHTLQLKVILSML